MIVDVTVHIHVGWIEVHDLKQLSYLKLVKEDDGRPVVVISMVIAEDLSVKVFVEDTPIPMNCRILAVFPTIINSTIVCTDLLNFLNRCVQCIGNDDERFRVLISSRKGNFMNGLE